MNKEEFRNTMRRNLDTYETLGECLGIHRQSVQNKVNGKTDFSRGEIEKLSKRWKLTKSQIVEIFFDEN